MSWFTHTPKEPIAVLISDKYSYGITQNQTSIGRDGDNNIQINFDGISRKHATIIFNGRNFFLQDSSSNGTFVNNQLIKNTNTPLKEDDNITFKKIDVKFVLKPIFAMIFDSKGGSHILSKNTPLTIGREGNIKLPPEYKFASREHALIGYDSSKNRFYIKDLKSANGTYINGKRVRDQVLNYLEDKDVIQFLEPNNKDSIKYIFVHFANDDKLLLKNLVEDKLVINPDMN